MKKLLTVLLSVSLLATMLTACGKKSDTTTETPTEAPTPTVAAEAAPTEAAATDTADESGVKTGLAVVSSLDSSSEADGLAETDSTAVAVLVGEDGTILACKIDASQAKINFTTEGKITTDLTAEVKTKQELGTEYSLSGVSGIGKEWNEQADAFAAYVVGKTVDEVKGIAVDEQGVPTGADLTSSVTIHVGDFISGVEKAVAGAQVLGAAETDKLGIAVSTDLSDSKDATADEAGLAEAYTFYSAVTTGTDGKITSCFVDASQGDVTFDTKGAITSDITAAPQTKQELKDAYDMKGNSGIDKEWYEQADAFSAYVTGKTVEDVKGIAVSEEGVAADADLVSSVTVHIAPFISIVEKAVTNAAQ